MPKHPSSGKYAIVGLGVVAGPQPDNSERMILAEAARLGFRRAVVPSSAPLDLPGIEVLRVRTLEQAVRLVCSDDLQQRRAS